MVLRFGRTDDLVEQSSRTVLPYRRKSASAVAEGELAEACP